MEDCEVVTGGTSEADVMMRPFELLSVVCTLGGAECPLVGNERAQGLIQAVREPACRIKLVSNADEVPYYKHRTAEDWASIEPLDVFNRKRDLDVLQKLGLTPGSITRSRYIYTLLFQKISTVVGLCAYDTPGWQGCPHARSGAYEKIRGNGDGGVGRVVAIPDQEEYLRRRKQCVEEIEKADRLYLQPHILMCICCDYDGGRGGKPRTTDDIYEIRRKMEADPDIEVTLVEGDLCMVCGSCDGFDHAACRCVHRGGLIRNFKKNLDVLQKLGLMPGATMKARELCDLLFERIPSTSDVCGYGDEVVTGPAWQICKEVAAASYERTRENPFV